MAMSILKMRIFLQNNAKILGLPEYRYLETAPDFDENYRISGSSVWEIEASDMLDIEDIDNFSLGVHITKGGSGSLARQEEMEQREQQAKEKRLTKLKRRGVVNDRCVRNQYKIAVELSHLIPLPELARMNGYEKCTCCGEWFDTKGQTELNVCFGCRQIEFVGVE